MSRTQRPRGGLIPLPYTAAGDTEKEALSWPNARD